MSSIPFNVFNEKCPSRNILEAISDKWSILIISKLTQNTFRFGELRRQLGNISHKMLAHTLQKLEKMGLVIREVYNSLPAKVEYSLTPLGRDLSRLLNELTQWTQNNAEHIVKSEALYLEKLH